MTRKRPDVDALRDLFAYDPRTGAIRLRRDRPSRRFGGTQPAGALATKRHSKGGLQVSVMGRTQSAAVVAWALHHGRWPRRGLQVDHANRDPIDNRITNLRECSRSQNAYNRRLTTTSTSGVRGVSWSRRRNRWRAYINHRGRRLDLGEFADIAQAAAVVRRARAKLHGEYARHE